MVKFCQLCKNQIDNDTTTFCPICGTRLSYLPARDPQGSKTQIATRKRSTIVWVVKICVVAILLILFSVSISAYNVAHTLSVLDIKSQALTVPYDKLLKNNEEYVGKIVYFRGTVGQIISESDDNYELIIDTSENPLNFNQNSLYVNYEGSRLSEGDYINLWGNVDGVITVHSVPGVSYTIPELTALDVEMITAEASGSSSIPVAVSTATPTPTQHGWVWNSTIENFNEV